MIKRPMLAHTIETKDWDSIKYPVWISPKLDGIRALVVDGVVYSRSMKPIRSKAVQELFGNPEYNGFDGELIYGSPIAVDCFNLSTSFCMSGEIPEGMNRDKIKYFVFDRWDIKAPYSERQAQIITSGWPEQTKVHKVVNDEVKNKEELEKKEQKLVELGYEGAMIRDPMSFYKEGKSTLKSGILGKIKRFEQGECIVIGFEEKLHNTNEAKTNELGYTERSSSKDGLVGTGVLGALLVKDVKTSMEFAIGSGYNDEQRKEIWDNKETWMGEIITYRYFAVQSGYDKPRFPTYVGRRDKDDM